MRLMLFALLLQTATPPTVTWTPLSSTVNGSTTVVGYVPSCPAGYKVWTTTVQPAPPPGPPQVQSSMPAPTRIGRTAPIKVDVARFYPSADTTFVCQAGS